MNPKRVLTRDTVVLKLKSETKDGILEELVNVLASAGKIKDAKSALKCVVERERKMSTGLQNGIAIPHGKSDTVDGLVAAIGLKKEGIAFDSLDGQPAQIILMTLSPATRTGPHIQFLADISRALHDPAVREKVINSATEEALIDAICGDKPVTTA